MAKVTFPLRSVPMLMVLSLLAFTHPAFAQGQGGGKGQDDDRREAKGKSRDRDDDRRQDKADRRNGKDRDRDEPRRAEPPRPPAPSARAPEPQRRVDPVRRHFEDRHKVVIRDYYVGEYRAGRCPPGLAKKNNGCMPPGQAKKWTMGQPLPRDVIFYDLPPTLVVHLGVPPPGYRFVRVASDILLIAIGTGMVIDAIMDLGNM